MRARSSSRTRRQSLDQQMFAVRDEWSRGSSNRVRTRVPIVVEVDGLARWREPLHVSPSACLFRLAISCPVLYADNLRLMYASLSSPSRDRLSTASRLRMAAALSMLKLAAAPSFESAISQRFELFASIAQVSPTCPEDASAMSLSVARVFLTLDSVRTNALKCVTLLSTSCWRTFEVDGSGCQSTTWSCSLLRMIQRKRSWPPSSTTSRLARDESRKVRQRREQDLET